MKPTATGVWTAVIGLLALTVQPSFQVSKAQLYPASKSVLNSELEDSSSQEIPLALPYSYFSKTYRSIFVNTNGMLSFDTEIPSFYNIQFPLNFPVIAVLYTDVDNRKGGTVTYGETQDQVILDDITDKIRKHFSFAEIFRMGSAFVATWDNVGYYDQKNDKGNTFQVVLASNGDHTFAILQYVDKGIQWIQSEGKTPGLPDAKAQVGFMTGDGRIYTVHGSGTDHVKNLDKLSNIGVPGVWMFYLGKLSATENIGLPDKNLGSSSFGEFQTCTQGFALCHTESTCVDYSAGYCCECDAGFYGNGQSCLEEGIPQRLNGKVNGILNGVVIQDVDLHSYVVVADGRQYTAISRVQETIGFDMQALVTIGGVIGWLFALPRMKAKNGFQLTGGVFNSTVDIDFPQTGHSVSIWQQFVGVDAFSYLQVHTEIKGTVPVLPSGSQLKMNDYTQEFNRVLPGMIRSQTSQSYHLEDTPNSVETQFKVDQILTFDECQHAPRDPELDTVRLHVARPFFTYDTREQIVRYAHTNKVSTLGGDDPCKEGRKQCGPDTTCIVENESFQCVCNPGYEYYYEEDATGQKTTCVDINECTTGRGNCHQFASCTNQLGSFQCACSPGYSGDGVRCTKTETCDDLNCDVNAECVAVGPSQALECRCAEGYEGNGFSCQPGGGGSPPEGSCQDRNDCGENAECVYSESEQRSYCTCTAGYQGDGYACVEQEGEESCHILNDCHPHAQCHYDSQSGTHLCRCGVGYEGDGYRCRAANVSCDQVNICSIYARCSYDPAQEAHVCVCESGYVGDGIDCRSADECDDPDACGPNAQCVFSAQEHKYQCVCDAGYVLAEDKTCSPDSGSPCNILDNCHPQAKCIQNPTSLRFECLCDEGYAGDGVVTCEAAAADCSVVFNCDANAECVQDASAFGHRCQCHEGFVGDGHSCVAGRPCNNDPSMCDPNADCVQVANLNQYVCQCLSGYLGDGHTCAEAPKYDGNFLIASQGMSIVRMPLQASRGDLGKPIIVEPLQTAIGLDVDCFAGHIYWSDVSGRAIKRSNYDGSNVEVFIDDDVESPEGLTVDWISRNLFWTDSLKDTIEVVRLDAESRDRKVLVETDLVNPRGIVAYPHYGLLFWSDWNRAGPKIEKAHMDGSERSVLVATNLELPNSLTIDHERQELCWADAGAKRIECCNLLGQNRRTIISAIGYPFGLSNNKQNFYWTDWESRKIEVASKLGGQLESPLEPPLGGSGKLYGVVAVPERCQRVSSPCSAQNGGCRHICLPNGYGGRTCACPDYTEDDQTPVCNEVP